MAEEWWKVVHDHLARRANPWKSARKVGDEEYGAVVRGAVIEHNGARWLKSPLPNGADSYIQIDGAHVGVGQLLVPATKSDRALAMRRKSQRADAARKAVDEPSLESEELSLVDWKQIQGAMEEQSKQLQGIIEEQSKEQTHLLDRMGDRLEALETLLAHQQGQLQQLGEVGSRLDGLQALVQECQAQTRGIGLSVECLSRGLSDLGLAHEDLRSRHHALCPRALGSDAATPSQQPPFCQAHARPELLRRAVGCPRASFAVQRLMGDGGAGIARLSLASHAFASVRAGVGLAPTRSDGAGQTPPSGAEGDLDETAWARLKRFTPPPYVLDDWTQSMTVHAALGLAGVEVTVGELDALRFSDVHEVFGLLGLTLNEFVNKFSLQPRARAPRDAKRLANQILRRLGAGGPDSTGDVMACRDLFRVLEVIGYPLSRFESVCGGVADLDSMTSRPPSSLAFPGYRVRRVIGRGGMNSACSFLAEDLADDGGARVAVKWPVPAEELDNCRELAGKDCLGVPHFVDHGTFEGKPYVVTEALGSSLRKVFERLEPLAWAQRWYALRVVGRLVLRRLRALHASGFVHCDVAPGNVLLGRPRGGGPSDVALYLIDFEHSQRHPGGRPLAPQIGSAEWSSVRSERGGERLPGDDLEALGWVLLHGFLGPLPWFQWLEAAYRDWGSPWARAQALRQAAQAKAQILRGGCGSCPGLLRPRAVPRKLAAFLVLSSGTEPSRPDYAGLLRLLGGNPQMPPARAEKHDLRLLREHVIPLL